MSRYRPHPPSRCSIAYCATPRPQPASGAGCFNVRRWAPPESRRRARASLPPVRSQMTGLTARAMVTARSTTGASSRPRPRRSRSRSWTELLRRTSLHPEVPSEVSLTFDAVYAAELDHWNFISQHFDPSTKRFWIPDGFFGGADDALDLTAVGKGVSGARRSSSIRIWSASRRLRRRGTRSSRATAAEAAGDESEHRVLGQTLAGASPPNNLGFEEFVFDNVGDIEAALVGAGFGLGQEGASPGRFYDFRNLRWPRRSRSARTNRNSSNTRRTGREGKHPNTRWHGSC